LRFFRSQITQQNFRAAIDLANQFCRNRPDVPDCSILPGHTTPLSTDPTDYRISSSASSARYSTPIPTRTASRWALHVRALGLYNFR
jgi:hypothetical protein